MSRLNWWSGVLWNYTNRTSLFHRGLGDSGLFDSLEKNQMWIKFLTKAKAIRPLVQRLGCLLLFLVCVFYRPFRRNPRRKLGQIPRKIIIIQMAKLGDMVCTTPMFAAVKTTYPDSTLFVMGAPNNEDILRFNPRIDKYLSWDGNISTGLSLLPFLRKEKFDFGCCTSPHFVGAALLFLASTKIIAVPRIEGGVSPYEGRAYKLLRKFLIQIPHGFRSLALREYLKLLEVIRIYRACEDKEVFLSSQGELKARIFFRTKGILSDDRVVGISPSSGNQLKRWPPERFGRLADQLVEHFSARVVLIGSDNDRQIVKKMLSESRYSHEFIDAVGKFSLAELPALMKRLDLFISVDTGSVYIADALGVTTIDISGPCAIETQAPTKGVIIRNEAVRCMPCSFIMNAPRICHFANYEYECTDTITVEGVLSAIDEVLSKSRAQSGGSLENGYSVN